MHALAVGAEQPAMDTQAVAEAHFAFVDGVGFGGEARKAGRLAVGIANAQGGVEFVGGEVEDDDVISQIEVSVRIDPLGPDDVFVHYDMAAHDKAHLVAARARGQVAA